MIKFWDPNDKKTKEAKEGFDNFFKKGLENFKKNLDNISLRSFDEIKNDFDDFINKNNEDLNKKFNDLAWKGIFNFEVGIKKLDYLSEIKKINKNLSNAPNNPQLIQSKIHMLWLMGKNKELVSFYDELLTNNPNDIEMLNGKGHSLISLGRYDEALPIFEKILSMNPNYDPALHGKEDVLKKLSTK